MPTKAELQKRLTAARADIERGRNLRADLARSQKELHAVKQELAAWKNTAAQEAGRKLAEAMTENSKLRTAAQEVGRELTEALAENSELRSAAQEAGRELTEAMAENKMLRSQYRPTSEQVKSCLAEIDRLKAIIGGG